MESCTTPAETGGFDFSNFKRNAWMASKGYAAPKATKTGTTIVGIIFKDGVVLGADTRATEGPIVADKNCSKIHFLAENMYCCGAGTAADTEFTTQLISSQLVLHRLNGGRQPKVATAMTLLKQYLFRHQGHISAALILGGVDFTGSHLYSIYPHGSVDDLPFVTMGSGSLAAMSVFEAGWRPSLERAEAISLVVDAIQAGIFNDLGSGSNVDVTVITKERVEILRNHVMPNERPPKEGSYIFPSGTTPIFKEAIKPLRQIVQVVEETSMDIS